MQGPRQHLLVHDRVAVEDDAGVGKQGRELCGGWIPFVYDQRVVEPRVSEPRVIEPRVADPEVIERAAHDRRTVDEDDRNLCAHGQSLWALRSAITGH